MKIDFRTIEVTDIEENKSTLDVSKELGNTIYNKTPDIGESDFAKEIYRQGEVEVDDQKAEIIRKYLEIGKFFAFVKKGVYEKLDSINNNNN
ncbi:hypothetical protein [Bacteroides thetaiotaomicron]|uniref:hypothetical protein n=1 Tax=Bacteroides thetaiotaomicron TaxID=818 RepID=UPI001898157C|nr:hypothetical protein [Bacteroides thetaiotaomicron]MCS2867119.1 hypothetical protein [Bacteroides thetaiotaomicron]MDC2274219.1 hypothetical protein [Bacteroides thetaiotaomicron]